MRDEMADRGGIVSAVDRILAAGAGSNGGIFKAFQDAPDAFAFGVDVNQCPQAPGVVMDNVEKKTDVAVELAIKGISFGIDEAGAKCATKGEW